MLLKADLLERIKAGEVDLVFRRWSRPSVKANGTLKTKLGVMSIGAITEMDPADVSDAEAKRAGFADVADFRRWLDTMKPGHLFQRIEVRFADEG